MCYRFDGLHSHNDKYHKQIEPSNYFEGSTSIIDHISHGETDNSEGAEEYYEYYFDGLYLWVGQIDMCVDIEDGDYGELWVYYLVYCWRVECCVLEGCVQLVDGMDWEELGKEEERHAEDVADLTEIDAG